MDLHRVFLPIAAQGFHSDADYAELFPCSALAPAIRCFWGSTAPHAKSEKVSRVIPDVCMDLVFEINHTHSWIRHHFCALDDAPSLVMPRNPGNVCETFGIRFYAWSAICFAEEDLRQVRSADSGSERYFSRLCRELEPVLLQENTLLRRARAAEPILWRHFHPDRLRPDLLNAIFLMCTAQGTLRSRDFAQYAYISERQLERLLLVAAGASPKLLSQLIRHQRVYRDLLEGRFQPMDAVGRYGYSDQSHLLRDFRRFHGELPSEILARMSDFF